jgi:hypothetical protein
MFILAADLVETVLRGVALDERDRNREREREREKQTERERVRVCVDRCLREMTSKGFMPLILQVILNYKAEFVTKEK